MTNQNDKNKTDNYKKVAENRRARFDYFIEDTVEAGIVLVGSEIKPLRAGKCSIGESYAEIDKDGDLALVNASIEEHGNTNAKWQHSSKRPRKLLLHKKQVGKIMGAVERKGYTVVPISMYFNDRGRVKVLLGIAKGKTQYDKRETEKKRDWNREKSKIMRGEKYN